MQQLVYLSGLSYRHMCGMWRRNNHSVLFMARNILHVKQFEDETFLINSDKDWTSFLYLFSLSSWVIRGVLFEVILQCYKRKRVLKCSAFCNRDFCQRAIAKSLSVMPILFNWQRTLLLSIVSKYEHSLIYVSRFLHLFTGST